MTTDAERCAHTQLHRVSQHGVTTRWGCECGWWTDSIGEDYGEIAAELAGLRERLEAALFYAKEIEEALEVGHITRAKGQAIAIRAILRVEP